jgi:hypothetical protein
MLTLVDPNNIKHCEFIRANDPFYWSDAPCWRVRVIPSLPPETVKITIEEKNRMAIQLVEAKLAPARLSKGGIVTCSTNFAEIMEALRTAKPDQAIVVKLDDPALLKEEKAALKLAMAVRRFFALKAIADRTAYVSGKDEITIRKMNTVELAKVGGRSKKK